MTKEEALLGGATNKDVEMNGWEEQILERKGQACDALVRASRVPMPLAAFVWSERPPALIA